MAEVADLLRSMEASSKDVAEVVDDAKGRLKAIEDKLTSMHVLPQYIEINGSQLMAGWVRVGERLRLSLRRGEWKDWKPAAECSAKDTLCLADHVPALLEAMSKEMELIRSHGKKVVDRLDLFRVPVEVR